MNFISHITGLPVPTSRPVRFGAYAAFVTVKGFVIGDPLAFGMAELQEEAAVLPRGTGYMHGRLHLRSRNFPMYYPGSSPRQLVISPQLVVMPIQQVPATMRQEFEKHVPGLHQVGAPDPEVLRNVLPCFEIFEDGQRLAVV